jgi:VWFA-related protein
VRWTIRTICLFALPLAALVLEFASPMVHAQQAAPAAPPSQAPTVRTTVDEVVLDLIVRDKKGKPITDLKPDEITVLENGAKQNLTSFRLVQGSEAVSESGSRTTLDPLRQIRLVTLAFESMGEPTQRKTARSAAIDLVKGDQGTNVYYSVVEINTRLLVLQPFTNDKAALTAAIERATSGLSVSQLNTESDKIKGDLQRYFPGQSAVQVAAQPVTNGSQALDAKLASIMLTMLRMDATMSSDDARLSLTALQSLVQGLQAMPGRKSVLYFTWGMYVLPHLDELFRSLESMANRANVTFYSVDTRGVMTSSQNAGAAGQLAGAAAASATTVNRTEGAVTKEEIMASDNAETAVRSNVQLPIRDLAESTGGFLIGDSNDLRVPLRRVNEEISSYYEVSYNPGIQNYDGSLRKIKVEAGRKDLVIHARSGYFALPPEVRSSGLQPFEMPLLKAIADGKSSTDVEFRSGPVLLQARNDATDLSVLVEVPLHGLQPKADAAKGTQAVHFSLAAVIKDATGEVVQKLTRDRSLQVTADQLKMGNFVEKMSATAPPGNYSLECAVMDREAGKIGMQRAEFTVAAKAKGVGISSLAAVRSYTPNAKGLTPAEPFQFQGGSITPTLNTSVARGENSALRLFFIVYPDTSISGAPTVEIEFRQNGQVLTKVPLPLPAADAQGKIPYVMTIPAAAIPPGSYEVQATAKQGDTASTVKTAVKIEAM